MFKHLKSPVSNVHTGTMYTQEKTAHTITSQPRIAVLSVQMTHDSGWSFQ